MSAVPAHVLDHPFMQFALFCEQPPLLLEVLWTSVELQPHVDNLFDQGFGRIVPVDVGHRLVRHQDPAVDAALINPEDGLVEDLPVTLVGEFLVTLQTLGSQRRMDGRVEAGQMTFEDQISRATMDQFNRLFLADGARDEDHGDPGMGHSQSLQGSQAVEPGQRQVAERHVRREFLQGGEQARFGFHPPPGMLWPFPLNLAPDQLRIGGPILDHQKF